MLVIDQDVMVTQILKWKLCDRIKFITLLLWWFMLLCLHVVFLCSPLSCQRLTERKCCTEWQSDLFKILESPALSFLSPSLLEMLHFTKLNSKVWFDLIWFESSYCRRDALFFTLFPRKGVGRCECGCVYIHIYIYININKIYRRIC